MLTVKFIVLGELRERYLRDACEEYKKRLSSMCALTELVVREQRLPDAPSPAEIARALDEEASRILPHLSARASAYNVALCVEGRQFTSEELAAHIERLTAMEGVSELRFVVGSSHGLSERVKERCVLRLSVSKLTLPHTLMRPLLYEIVYRELSILAGKRYHK